MRVIHLYKSESGGAGKAARRLIDALNAFGVEAVGYTESKFIDDNSGPANKSPIVKLLLDKLKRRRYIKANNLLFDSKEPASDFFSNTSSPFSIRFNRLLKGFDIVHLHWITGFVDIHELLSVCKMPIVVTQHDMNYFTGGCHYSFGCKKYNTECNACPQVKQSYQSIVGEQFKKKISTYQNSDNIVFISPSKWLYDLSSNSLLLGKFKHFCIPNCISIKGREEKKSDFHTKYLLVIASDLDSARKGGDFLKKNLSDILQCGFEIYMIGNSNIEYSDKRIHVIGDVVDEELLFSYYRNAVATLMLTIEDNLPNVLLESLACGTPVIGFRTGGLLDFVKDGFNGYLVDKYDLTGLINAIQHIDDLKWDKESIRRNILQVVSNERIAEQYYNLYKMILSDEASLI